MGVGVGGVVDGVVDGVVVGGCGELVSPPG